MKLEHFVLDVDGVLTTGQFAYTIDGKVMKVFGAHDADGLKLIRDHIKIQFITADKRGFAITKKRIDDMGYPLTYVTEEQRYDYVKSLGFHQTVFMGDGYYDAPVLSECALSFCPANARQECKDVVTHITESRSAEGAVMDACLIIKEKYL